MTAHTLARDTRVTMPETAGGRPVPNPRRGVVIHAAPTAVIVLWDDGAIGTFDEISVDALVPEPDPSAFGRRLCACGHTQKHHLMIRCDQCGCIGMRSTKDGLIVRHATADSDDYSYPLVVTNMADEGEIAFQVNGQWGASVLDTGGARVLRDHLTAFVAGQEAKA